MGLSILPTDLLRLVFGQSSFDQATLVTYQEPAPLVELPLSPHSQRLRQPLTSLLWAPTLKLPHPGGKKEAPFKIIPLNKLHHLLTRPGFNTLIPRDDETDVIYFHVRFYATWFPKETRHQFDKAWNELRAHKKEVGWAFLALENAFVPNEERFFTWLSEKMSSYPELMIKRKERPFLTEEEKSTISILASLANAWVDVAPHQREKVSEFFKPLSAFVHRPDFDWSHTRLFSQIGFLLNLSQAAQENSASPSPVFDENFFNQDPEKMVSLNGVDYSKMNPAEAQKMWDFFKTHVTALHRKPDFWNSMNRFLTAQNSLVPDFVGHHSLWIDSFKKDDNTRDEASEFYVYNIYEHILKADKVPPEVKKETYLLLISHEKKPELTRKWQNFSLGDIEIEIICTTIQSLNHENAFSSVLSNVGMDLFGKYAKRLGSQKMAELLQIKLPPEIYAKLSLSLRMLTLLTDPTDEEIMAALNEIAHWAPETIHAVQTDFFLPWVWTELGGTPLYGFYESVDLPVKFQRALKSLPEILIQRGHINGVRKYFLSQHPYAPLLTLPDELKPTGKELSFASVDSFYNLVEKGHPDKNKITILGKPAWSSGTKSHGILTTSLAVGETYGMTQAELAIVSIREEVADFPIKMAESLEKILQEADRNPSLKVVGLSLGLEVPQVFRSHVFHSQIFKRLKKVVEKLHEKGIVVIVSAGNDGKKDHINILGFIPHIILVGAVDNRNTPHVEDDRVSNYSTGADVTNPIRLAALADPVMAPLGYDENVPFFAWIEQGGTSSAQPHVSGAILF
ncbi:MAG TPA: hypothetical protein DDW49_03005 [Deltaproteobacteria bacterium]|nr:hypothetical protein [Deltaproteobacteria bacterium]